MPMAVKHGRMMTCNEKRPLINSHDFLSRGLMRSRDNLYLDHISTCNRTMTIKHLKLLTYHEGFPLRKSYNPLNK